MNLSAELSQSSTKDMPMLVLWSWRFCWIMFGLSFFTSKSGLSIFSALLLLISLFFINWNTFIKDKWMVLFAATVPIGMFLNLFSLGGWESSIKFLLSNPWPLLVIPGYCLIQKEKEIRFFLWPLILGFCAALIKSAEIFYHTYEFIFTSQARVHSFYDIGRWGQFIATAAVALLGLSYPTVIKDKRILICIRILFVLSFVFLLLSNTRGPWLGFAGGAMLIVLLMRKYLKTMAILVLLVSAVAFSSDGVFERVNSIFAVSKDASGKITSDNTSNAGRLHMWQVALDRAPENLFFGTGFRNTEAPLRAFLDRQSDEYKNKYITAQFSLNDSHSSYLQSLTEMGILFFIIYWSSLVYCLVFFLNEYFKTGISLYLISGAIIFSSLIIFVFYSSYETYEAALLSLGVVMGAYALAMRRSKTLTLVDSK